jgi:hypothetical protein
LPKQDLSEAGVRTETCKDAGSGKNLFDGPKGCKKVERVVGESKKRKEEGPKMVNCFKIHLIYSIAILLLNLGIFKFLIKSFSIAYVIKKQIVCKNKTSV